MQVAWTRITSRTTVVVGIVLGLSILILFFLAPPVRSSIKNSIKRIGRASEVQGQTLTKIGEDSFRLFSREGKAPQLRP